MSEQRITRLVFRVDGVLLSGDGSPVASMPALVAELAQSVDVRAAAFGAPARDRLSALDAYRTLLPAERVILAPIADPPVLFDRLVRDKIILPGHTLWIDHDPHRAMTAIRLGLDAALFEDAARLYRDLGLWGLVPLIPDKAAARAHLLKPR
jgi:hypothetical protein